MTLPNSNLDRGDRVSIGLRDLYDQLYEMSRGYAALAAKLDTALITQRMIQESLAQQLETIKGDQRDHEMRLRGLEKRQFISPKMVWTALGVIGGFVSIIVAIIAIIVK